MKYKVVVDSTVYLSEEEFSKYDIHRASLKVIDKNESFDELSINSEFVYGRLNSGHHLTTSQPSPGEFMDIYEKLLKEGTDKIFVICLAKPLSGTYQSAVLAKNMLDNPERVHVFESNMAAFGNEMLTLEAVNMIESGKTESEIITRIDALIETSNLVFTLGGLTHLAKSWRLSRAKALVGSVLRVKPLIKMVDGKLDLYKAERTGKKVISSIIKLIKETTEGSEIIHFRILTHNALEQARILEEEIKSTFKNIKLTFNEYLGPIFCLHLGETGFGVSWCTE